MDPTVKAFLSSWSFDPWLALPLLITAGVYLHGYAILRRRGGQRWQPRHLTCFLSGLTVVWLALQSPLDAFASLLLQIHMVQHLLLMVVAPPLLWLGAPQLPLLAGLPSGFRDRWVAPLLRQECLLKFSHHLTHPVVTWCLFLITIWAWHLPILYEAALKDPRWHYWEHVCFLTASLLFWWPVIQPYPSRPRLSRWFLLPYLLLAGVQGTALSGLLTFSQQLLYAHYETVPRLWNTTPLSDQAVAGVIMWVPGSLTYLTALVVVVAQLFTGRDQLSWSPATVNRRSSSVPLRSGPHFGQALPDLGLGKVVKKAKTFVPAVPPARDLLRTRWLGQLLVRRHLRLLLKTVTFGLASLIVIDGWLGPQVSPINLAGTLPWIHWRGLLLVGLLFVGNLFCMVCPFTLPRSLAQRWLPARLRWPRTLKNKYLAIALLVLFFWAYEAFQLWDRPWWTATMIVGYFVAAFAVDTLFHGASFCKYVCPIGQFNFVQSLCSPRQVKVRRADVCHDCTTKECMRGSARVSGCQLQLVLPTKASNMDCTFCLDCVEACPHDNIGLLAVGPTFVPPELASRGRDGLRNDVTALVMVLVFASLVNAAWMIAPVVAWEERLVEGGASRLWVVTLGTALTLLLAPALCVIGVGRLSGWWGNRSHQWLTDTRQSVYVLLPLGFAMWLAHFAFHLLTSAGTAVAAGNRLLTDWGVTSFNGAVAMCGCCGEVADWILPFEIVCLDIGLCLSLYLLYRLADTRYTSSRQAIMGSLPWAFLLLAFFAAGVWIFLQPMQMRGTMAVGV